MNYEVDLLKEIKRKLTHDHGSLISAARKLRISYDWLINKLNGRTNWTAEDKMLFEKNLGIPSEMLDFPNLPSESQIAEVHK